MNDGVNDDGVCETLNETLNGVYETLNGVYETWNETLNGVYETLNEIYQSGMGTCVGETWVGMMETWALDVEEDTVEGTVEDTVEGTAVGHMYLQRVA